MDTPFQTGKINSKDCICISGIEPSYVIIAKINLKCYDTKSDRALMFKLILIWEIFMLTNARSQSKSLVNCAPRVKATSLLPHEQLL